MGNALKIKWGRGVTGVNTCLSKFWEPCTPFCGYSGSPRVRLSTHSKDRAGRATAETETPVELGTREPLKAAAAVARGRVQQSYRSGCFARLVSADSKQGGNNVRLLNQAG